MYKGFRNVVFIAEAPMLPEGQLSQANNNNGVIGYARREGLSLPGVSVSSRSRLSVYPFQR